MTDVADADADDGANRDPDDAEREAPGEGTTADGTAGPDDPAGPDELVARIAAADEAAAAEVAALRERVDELESALAERESELAEWEETVEELESKLKRARADFQNYKKRAKEREEELRQRATEDLVERLLDVRDNLIRALEQDDDVEVREGVEATLATFDRVLDAESVAAIEPDPADEVDPRRHEVVHRTESGEPEGTIADVYRPGYEMAGTVLRPAQVTVSEGSSSEDADPDGSETAADESQRDVEE